MLSKILNIILYVAKRIYISKIVQNVQCNSFFVSEFLVLTLCVIINIFHNRLQKNLAK